MYNDKILQLSPEDLKVTLKYRSRQYPIAVESEASHAVEMMVVTDKPGRYTGFGNVVVED